MVWSNHAFTAEPKDWLPNAKQIVEGMAGGDDGLHRLMGLLDQPGGEVGMLQASLPEPPRPLLLADGDNRPRAPEVRAHRDAYTINRGLHAELHDRRAASVEYVARVRQTRSWDHCHPGVERPKTPAESVYGTVPMLHGRSASDRDQRTRRPATTTAAGRRSSERSSRGSLWYVTTSARSSSGIRNRRGHTLAAASAWEGSNPISARRATS